MSEVKTDADVDGYLTRMVQENLFLDGIVIKYPDPSQPAEPHEKWVIQRSDGSYIGIGISFKGARQTISGMINARSRNEDSNG